MINRLFPLSSPHKCVPATLCATRCCSVTMTDRWTQSGASQSTGALRKKTHKSQPVTLADTLRKRVERKGLEAVWHKVEAYGAKFFLAQGRWGRAGGDMTDFYRASLPTLRHLSGKWSIFRQVKIWRRTDEDSPERIEFMKEKSCDSEEDWNQKSDFKLFFFEIKFFI